MEIIFSDNVVRQPNPPNYNVNNPLVKLAKFFQENIHLAAEIELYETKSLQGLIPFSSLEMYGPSGNDTDILDPQQQNNKQDFQKQNVKDFTTTDTYIVRGIVSINGWTGSFLRVSYDGSPDSKLSQFSSHSLSDHIKLWLKVQNSMTTQLLRVPYNEESHRYEVEIWGYPGTDLRDHLDDKGRKSLDQGKLIIDIGLVHGSISDFAREKIDDQDISQIAPTNTVHPVNILKIELAWADHLERFWDSQNGTNYHYQFNMTLRGWGNFIKSGISANPHGGVGFLHYRNLLSNYSSSTSELARPLKPWMFNADGNKSHAQTQEKFLAVDYIDLHILQPNCGIGLHRHRDNQEIFFMMEGEGVMIMGDWCKFPDRERCFEVRFLCAGDIAFLKSGQLHGLINNLQQNIYLLMFGGYD